jgi:SAM-dependent methyltransferase
MGGRMRCLMERAWLEALRRIFRFDAWHANAPYACRPYKKSVIDLANSLHPTTVVEVGCGLGDIVSRIQAENRYGLDLDARVIRAARFLHPRHVAWIVGGAAKLGEQEPPILAVDCLIMVNWIHNLSVDELASTLAPLLPKTRHLIVDAVDQDAPASYRVRHDFGFLSGKATQLAAIRVSGEPRRFLLWRVEK